MPPRAVRRIVAVRQFLKVRCRPNVPACPPPLGPLLLPVGDDRLHAPPGQRERRFKNHQRLPRMYMSRPKRDPLGCGDAREFRDAPVSPAIQDWARVAMSQRILFVDDDDVVLAVIRRQLRSQFQFDTARNAQEALVLLSNSGPYAVVVSDMRMPDMDGITLLARARDLCPDIVRIMLTGVADLQVAIDAVNRGSIFRFLTKPWPADVLVAAISAGIEQHRLITSERLLLERTLIGSVQVLTEILSLVNPTAFRRTAAIREYARHIATVLQAPNRWQIELAAALSQIGCVALPEETLRKAYLGDPLTPDEQDLYSHHPAVGARLLSRIPRLEVVAAMIAAQDMDTKSEAADNTGGNDAIILGGHILRVALAYDRLMAQGFGHSAALTWLARRPADYPPAVVDALASIEADHECQPLVRVSVPDLRVGMVLAEDVLAANGAQVLPAGERISEAVEARLRSFARIVGLQEPLVVYAT